MPSLIQSALGNLDTQFQKLLATLNATKKSVDGANTAIEKFASRIRQSPILDVGTPGSPLQTMPASVLADPKNSPLQTMPASNLGGGNSPIIGNIGGG